MHTMIETNETPHSVQLECPSCGRTLVWWRNPSRVTVLEKGDFHEQHGWSRNMFVNATVEVES